MNNIQPGSPPPERQSSSIEAKPKKTSAKEQVGPKTLRGMQREDQGVSRAGRPLKERAAHKSKAATSKADKKRTRSSHQEQKTLPRGLADLPPEVIQVISQQFAGICEPEELATQMRNLQLLGPVYQNEAVRAEAKYVNERCMPFKALGIQTADDALAFAKNMGVHLQYADLTGIPLTCEQVGELVDCCPNINTLKVPGSTIDEKGVAYIARLTALRNVDLSECNRVTDAHLEGLFINQPELQSLNISGCPQVTDASAHRIANLKNLRHLNLGLSPISDKGLTAVVDSLTQLESLDVSSNGRVSEASLRNVGNLKNLSSLNISSCEYMGDAALQQIAKLKGLKSLQCAHCFKITDSGLAYLEGVKTLENLDLKACRITAKGMKSIGKMIHLKSLNIGNCRVEDDWLKELVGLTQLEALDVSNIELPNNRPLVTDEGLKHIACLIALRSLNLHTTSVTDEGVKRLTALPELNTLDIASCRGITSAVWQEIAKLESLQDLTIHVLGDLTNLPSINVRSLTLNIDLFTVSDTDLRQLAALKGLESLSLSGGPFANLRGGPFAKKLTDDGIKYIASELKLLESIRMTTLSSDVTNEGVKAFASLPRLRRILVDRCPRVTKEAFAEMPKRIQVTYWPWRI